VLSAECLVSFFLYGTAISAKSEGHSNVICRDLKLLCSSFRKEDNSFNFLNGRVIKSPEWQYRPGIDASTILQNEFYYKFSTSQSTLATLMNIKLKPTDSVALEFIYTSLKYSLEIFGSLSNDSRFFSTTARYVNRFEKKKIVSVAEFLMNLSIETHSCFKSKLGWYYNCLKEMDYSVHNECKFSAAVETKLNCILLRQVSPFCCPFTYNKTTYIIVPSMFFCQKQQQLDIFRCSFFLRYSNTTIFPVKAMEKTIRMFEICEAEKPETLVKMDDIVSSLLVY